MKWDQGVGATVSYLAPPICYLANREFCDIVPPHSYLLSLQGGGYPWGTSRC